jgi:transposase-like protein
MAVMLRDDERRCPTCASTRLESKGYTATVTKVYQRYICRSCGAYSRRVRGEPGSVEVR